MIPKPLNVYIGYDSREPLAYHVLAHSILRRASRPVPIVPLALDSLKDMYWRERTSVESTEFSMTRFLVPFLSGYQGYSLFMDSDMLCLTDICKLSDELNSRQDASHSWSIACCQHDYTPKAATKMDGQIQTAYPRKNWSSFMIFDNARCMALSPMYINEASGLDLHRFNWLSKYERIASIPLEWNWLVGEYERNSQAHVLHFTEGGPWFEGTRDCDHADLWKAELEHMLAEGVRV